MEGWQIKAITELLETGVKEVETGERFYTSSQEYGNSRYHLLNRQWDGVQVEQIETDEKWAKRVTFATGELPQVLKVMLTWYLGDKEKLLNVPDSDDALGDLDEHPF